MQINEMLSFADELRPRTATDQIFDLLYERVVNLALPPGTRLSEADVATQMGVSRQPVRDAFYRLSQMGFILIRPQRATIVTPISEKAVMQAYFIRLALEEACIRLASGRLTTAHHDHLADLIARQQAAVESNDRAAFHQLDDQFHQDICKLSELDFVWSLIREKKGHMDRARYLSLGYGAKTALDEHRTILDALRQRDADAATAAIRRHLTRIEDILARLTIDRPGVIGP